VSSAFEKDKEAEPETDKAPACAETATREPANADNPIFFKFVHINFSLF
jgi:hypothetical protein